MNLPLWFSNLAFWSAQVALLALAAAMLVRLLRIGHPGALLLHWRALLAVSLLLPVLQPWRRQQIFAGVSAAPGISFSQGVPAAGPAASLWPFPTWAFVAEILGLVIVLGIAARLATFIVGLVKLRQLRLGSSAIPPSSFADTLERTCALAGARAEFRISAQVASPVTFGFAAPLILLPERFLRLDGQSQAAVACHELLHVRRRDWAHHLVEEFLRVGFWFHPAILWLVARIRLAREQVVDLEVIRLTKARRTYLEALLEFTSTRNHTAAVPAPPFLAERQFGERVSLMLKEVRMSRAKLIASLFSIACALAVVAIFAVSAFPLKASPRLRISSQAAAASATSSLASRPVVDASTVRFGQVRRGMLPVWDQCSGTLIPGGEPGQLLAEVLVSGDVVREVQLSQRAFVNVDGGKALVTGHVANIGPADPNGNRWTDIWLDSPLPAGIGANTRIVGFIQVGRLENVLYIDRPAYFFPGLLGMPTFKVVDGGTRAVRMQVDFGRSNAGTVQILAGLNEGDTVVLSDLSPYDRFSRIQIKH